MKDDQLVLELAQQNSIEQLDCEDIYGRVASYAATSRAGRCVLVLGHAPAPEGDRAPRCVRKGPPSRAATSSFSWGCLVEPAVLLPAPALLTVLQPSAAFTSEQREPQGICRRPAELPRQSPRGHLWRAAGGELRHLGEQPNRAEGRRAARGSQPCTARYPSPRSGCPP